MSKFGRKGLAMGFNQQVSIRCAQGIKDSLLVEVTDQGVHLMAKWCYPATSESVDLFVPMDSLDSFIEVLAGSRSFCAYRSAKDGVVFVNAKWSGCYFDFGDTCHKGPKTCIYLDTETIQALRFLLENGVAIEPSSPVFGLS